MTTEAPLALQLTALSKRYKNGFEAVKKLNLRIRQGDFFALLGPNGAGKSTTVGMISTLIKQTEGRIEVLGVDLNQHPAQAKQVLGVVPQEININGFEKPWHILIQQAGYYGVKRALAAERAEYYLKALHLWDKAHQPAIRLSGGMKRRLMIARALVHEPKVLLLDEPTAGVDVEIRQEMWAFLSRVRRDNGLTIVLTTHYLEEAESLCNRIAIIKNGALVIDTDMRALLMQLECETVILYLANAITTCPEGLDFPCRLLDERTLEIELAKQQALGTCLLQLQHQGVVVQRMRNKSNRLEQLFVHLVRGAAT